jgi:hypothetical protein
MLLTQVDERRKLCIGELRVVFCSEVVFERGSCCYGLSTSIEASEYLSVRTPDVCGPSFQGWIANISPVTVCVEAYIRLEIPQVMLSEVISIEVQETNAFPTSAQICSSMIYIGCKSHTSSTSEIGLYLSPYQ